MSTSESPAPDTASGETDTDLGKRLRITRESMDLSIDDVSAELRITVEALTALEDSRFSEIGAPVFAKGYLKQYAAHLGLNVSEMADEFDRASGLERVVIEPSRTIRLGGNHNLTAWVLGLITLAIVAVLAWYGWQFWDGLQASADETAAADAVPEASPESIPAMLPETGSAASPAAARELNAEMPEAQLAEPPAGTMADVAATPIETLTDPALVEVPELVAPEPLADQQVAPEPLADEPVPDHLSQMQAAADGPVLVVSFFEDSWSEITAESGERLYFGLGEAGTQATIPAEYGTQFLFGNGGGVGISLDGESLAIPGQPDSGMVASFTFEELTD